MPSRHWLALLALPAGIVLLGVAGAQEDPSGNLLYAPPLATSEMRRGEPKLIHLQNTKVMEISQALHEVFGQQPGVSLSMAAITSRNVLLLRAPEKEMAEIEAICQQLDEAAKPHVEATEIRIFSLQHARGRDVHSVVSQLIDQSNQTVVEVPNSNALLARGSKEWLDQMEAICLKLDGLSHERAEPPTSTH